VVRAAGGVLWRRGDDSDIEVLIVHRPKYDDWTLPKGKADEGESDEECALREVAEETGLACELGSYLGQLSYRDQHDRPKVARFWAMQCHSGELTPSAEVDEIKWLPVPDALATLSRREDGEMVEALVRSEA
jgi:8-oxo-dGTP pyrophosphatase MutT (NUDIX family)